jgi:uncharacterized protein YqgC (DUF456 family)
VIAGVEPLVAVAFLLLVGAVVGSVVPLLPGPLLSLAGVVLYWAASGYSEPSLLVLVVLVVVALLGVVVDLFGGALGAKAGGASTRTTTIAAVVGLLLFFVAGPVGVVLGVAGTVFAIEFVRNQDARAGGRAALAATAGVLGSAVVQVLLTLSILLAMVLVVVL